MSAIFKFGEDVDGYTIPVLNEREIRAGAGLLFVVMFVAILVAILKHDFLLLKYGIVIFLTDILVRVLVSPRFAPSLILGRWTVRNQVPEYVGAAQKKFAWIIGVVLASTMFVLVNIVNSYSIITGLICLICLVFLFCETAFGLCIGCKVYGLIRREKAQYCPGETCDVASRHPIQKTSWVQALIVPAFVAYIYLAAVLFNDHFKAPPHALFGPDVEAPTESR
ncbi:MAG TPA: DUF4395 domain-containing protein [Candidatus Krumholzibacteria bacterium]|nr:DUF4395 domain-containing protein [Candidatus Krumholzibacteria bacterium]